jgi:TetR/AcrR family transcriptional regulator, transcriptional repressor for nem operon
MGGTAERLMDLAEARIREAGYRGFSFRDLAAEIGIKSASVHHHFPTKAGMAAAVARRYRERFFEIVAARHDEGGDDVVAIYRSAFRSAIERDGGMCLNGMLGAEAGGLPPEVVEEIKTFFRRCVGDLTSRIGGTDDVAHAFHVMAALEGGLILARAFGDITAFDQATASLSEPRFDDGAPLHGQVTGHRTISPAAPLAERHPTGQ